jgi:hypothetical protein
MDVTSLSNENSEDFSSFLSLSPIARSRYIIQAHVGRRGSDTVIQAVRQSYGDG